MYNTMYLHILTADPMMFPCITSLYIVLRITGHIYPQGSGL